MTSTSGGLARWTLSCGAGVPAGSPPSSALGSLRWPVPVPTRSACPRRAGRCDVWRATCASSRSSRSRRRTWGESSQAGLSFQRTRTWKASPDPDYEAKAARVLALYAAEPEDGVVVSFDQMGPISLRPTAGAGWAPRKLPERQRATYTRPHGTRYVFGAYDVHADRLRVRLRPRRRGSDNLAFLKQIRACYPRRLRIYWIQDNLSANWTPDIRAYADANNIELVPTPTYASYLNRVECHFLPISEFVVKNADYLNWDAFAFALARHMTDRNGAPRAQRLIDLERRHQIAA